MAAGADHFAREFSKKAEQVITADRECTGCGYNLRGLRNGGHCPECGSAIERSFSHDYPLASMPWRVIRVFLAGAWLAAISVVVALAGVWLVQFQVISPEVASFGLPVLAVLWAWGMFMLTPAFSFSEAAQRGFSRRSRLRRIARMGQVAWIIAAVAFTVRLNAPLVQVVSDTVGTLMVLAIIVGWSATFLLALLFERLAEWVRDDTAERMFNWFVWATPISAFMLWVVSGSMGMLAGIVATALTMLAIAFFPLGVLMLARSITFSWQHHVENESREERRAERTRREADRMNARLGEVDPAIEQSRPRV